MPCGCMVPVEDVDRGMLCWLVLAWWGNCWRVLGTLKGESFMGHVLNVHHEQNSFLVQPGDGSATTWLEKSLCSSQPLQDGGDGCWGP